MLVSISLFGRIYHMYGICIAVGVIIANICAIRIIKKYSGDIDYFIVSEGYTLLSAILCSKLLYLFVSRDRIDWHSFFTSFAYFNSIMQGGFVFLGGLIGGIIGFFLAGYIHKIDQSLYLHRLVFIIPLAHAFGRIGCFCAGCCYGKPYNGPLAVRFPAGSYAPHGVSLFPLQLLESILLFIAAAIFYRKYSVPENERDDSLLSYLIVYCVARFIMEFFRYDSTERGFFSYYRHHSGYHLQLLWYVGYSILYEIRNAKATDRIRSDEGAYDEIYQDAWLWE